MQRTKQRGGENMFAIFLFHLKIGSLMFADFLRVRRKFFDK